MSRDLEPVAVILMAKWPSVGRVKTRLSSRLTLEQAADVYRTFLVHVVGRLSQIGFGEVIVAYDPPDAESAMRDLLSPLVSATYVAQPAGDLGQRLAVIAEQVGRRRQRMLFLGVDSPDVPDEHLIQAATLTAEADVSLGPTTDGGYWCLGLQSHADAGTLLSNINWSSGAEAQQTLDRATELNYRVTAAPKWDDVDHPADLDRLLDRLRRSASPDDRRLLDQLSFLRDGATHD